MIRGRRMKGTRRHRNRIKMAVRHGLDLWWHPGWQFGWGRCKKHRGRRRAIQQGPCLCMACDPKTDDEIPL